LPQRHSVAARTGAQRSDGELDGQHEHHDDQEHAAEVARLLHQGAGCAHTNTHARRVSGGVGVTAQRENLRNAGWGRAGAETIICRQRGLTDNILSVIQSAKEAAGHGCIGTEQRGSRDRDHHDGWPRRQPGDGGQRTARSIACASRVGRSEDD
jgi:hypothetical protein